MNAAKMTPLPGFVLVEIDEAHSDIMGGIVLPQVAERPGYTGRVVAIPRSSRTPIEMDAVFHMHGKRVVCRGARGARLYGRLYRFAVQDIEAVLSGGAAAKVNDPEHPRCRFCGEVHVNGCDNRRNAHLLVRDQVNGWYCPRCRRKPNGSMASVTVASPDYDQKAAAARSRR